MKRNIVAIIQARLGSTRLPYKMMLNLHNHAIIEWVITRVLKSKKINKVIVAIPDNEENIILKKFLKKFDINVYCGSEDNVLDRFFKCAKKFQATHIVRICADNPLISSEEIDNLINFYFKNPCDYAYNHIPKNNLYPDGLGAEIISYEVLDFLHKNVVKKEHQEHCLSYIWDNEINFNIKTFNPLNKNLHHPDLKFDIDTLEDYKKLFEKEVYINIKSEDLIKLYKGK